MTTMDPALAASILAAIEKLEGFDARFEEHASALRTNKIAIEALLPAVLAINVQLLNMVTQLMRTQMAVLRPTEKHWMVDLAQSLNGETDANDAFVAATDAFTRALNVLAAKNVG